MNQKIAIIGPASLITGFKALGLTPYPATSQEELITLIKEIKTQANEIGIILVAEVLMVNLEASAWEELTSDPEGPAIITIPCLETSANLGKRKLDRLTERAIGYEID